MSIQYLLTTFLLIATCSCSVFSITGKRLERSLEDEDDDWERDRMESANLSATINEILASYDPKLRPNAGGDPVKVTVEIKIVSFGELNEANMEYSLDIFFRQWWHDPRLKHNSSTPFNMAADPTEIFWTPDTYFFNVKQIKYHFVTRENMRVMIYSTGEIYFSARITLTAQCDMDLRLYPMDTQHCSLIIESYAHTTDDVDFKWYKTKENNWKGIEIVSQTMAQFELTGIETKIKDTENSKGSFASLSVMFSFKRRLEYFVSSVFSPAVTLVMLSWCCFWIDRHSVPARVSLGITTILTAIVLCGSTNEGIPPVSYMKAQDFFLLGSFGFIFLSFLEFVVVLNTNPEPRWFRRLKSLCIKESRKSSFTDLETETTNPTDNDLGVIHTHTRTYTSTLPQRVVVSNTGQGATVLLLDKYGQMHHGNFHEKAANHESRKKRDACARCSHWVDVASRIIFPASYVIFLLLFRRKFVQQ